MASQRVRKAVPGVWRCRVCGKPGKGADAMAEFYVHWRSYHFEPPHD